MRLAGILRQAQDERTLAGFPFPLVLSLSKHARNAGVAG